MHEKKRQKKYVRMRVQGIVEGVNAICRVWYCDFSVAEAMRKQRTVMLFCIYLCGMNIYFIMIAHKAAAFPGSTDAWAPAGSVSMRTPHAWTLCA